MTFLQGLIALHILVITVGLVGLVSALITYITRRKL